MHKIVAILIATLVLVGATASFAGDRQAVVSGRDSYAKNITACPGPGCPDPPDSIDLPYGKSEMFRGAVLAKNEANISRGKNMADGFDAITIKMPSSYQGSAVAIANALNDWGKKNGQGKRVISWETMRYTWDLGEYRAEILIHYEYKIH